MRPISYAQLAHEAIPYQYLGSARCAGAAFQFSSVSAAQRVSTHSATAMSAPLASPTASPSPSPSCPPMALAIAFTKNVADASVLHLHLPWGRPGDAQGTMVEDYGSYNGTTIRKHLPVHDVTTGSLVELFGHNAIDIVLDSGTPLYAVTSGTAYRTPTGRSPAFPRVTPRSSFPTYSRMTRETRSRSSTATSESSTCLTARTSTRGL